VFLVQKDNDHMFISLDGFDDQGLHLSDGPAIFLPDQTTPLGLLPKPIDIILGDVGWQPDHWILRDLSQNNPTGILFGLARYLT
jgi:hypothetical protein